MLRHEFNREAGIVSVWPTGRLAAGDFESLAAEVDPYIKEHGSLHGLIIETEKIPGWQNLEALKTHLKFVGGHHRQIDKVAMVTGSPLLSAAPKIIDHFVGAEVRHFKDRTTALGWIQASQKQPPQR